MPVQPTVIERLLFYRLNRGPGTVIDLIGSAGIHAAVTADDIGIFDALVEGEASVVTLSTDLEVDERGLEALLGFLDRTGYVDRTGAGYALSGMSRRWLTDAEGTNLLPWFRFWIDQVFPFWASELDRAIRTGSPGRTLYEWLGDDEAAWRVAQRGFQAAASILADRILDDLDVPADASVLDLGGGHGSYSIELARRHPTVDCTVFDLPPALGQAREALERTDLEDRVTLVGGDYRTDDLEGPYDLVLVFNVIHAHEAAEAQALLTRIGDALAPGGSVAILDQFAGSARLPVAKSLIAFVDLSYFVTLGARAHDLSAVEDWLESAGFAGMSTETYLTAPGSSLLTATKRLE